MVIIWPGILNIIYIRNTNIRKMVGIFNTSLNDDILCASCMINFFILLYTNNKSELVWKMKKTTADANRIRSEDKEQKPINTAAVFCHPIVFTALWVLSYIYKTNSCVQTLPWISGATIIVTVKSFFVI